MARFDTPDTVTHSDRDPTAVGHLSLDGHSYRIVVLACKNGQDTAVQLGPHAQAHLPIVGQFTIDQSVCGIVDDAHGQAAPGNDLVDLLTPRELQIVSLVAKGRLNKQVARQLRISEWTVATHLRRVFAKLGVDTRAAMVYRCSTLLSMTNTIDS